METMNIFEGIKVFGKQTWEVISSRVFNEKEIALIDKVEVVPGEYGKQAKIYFKSGGYTFMTLSRDCTKSIGEPIDIKEAKLLTLKQGNTTINRLDI